LKMEPPDPVSTSTLSRTRDLPLYVSITWQKGSP
jgi:hypothetical protein